MLDGAEVMNKVDQAYALAASGRPRRDSFAASDGLAILDVLERRADSTILPRRLTVSGGTGAHITLLLRRRQLVGIAEVSPAQLWTGNAPLPAQVEDDESGDLLAEAAATAIAKVIETAAQIDIRFDFPHAGDETAGEGLTFDALAAPLESLLPGDNPAGNTQPAVNAPQDRPSLLADFYDRMTGLPRMMLAPERRIDLPATTPSAIRKLFESVGPAHVKHKAGDATEILVFEQGGAGNALTVKVSDETRLCLVHAGDPAQAQALMDATWKLKRLLEAAAAPLSDDMEGAAQCR